MTPEDFISNWSPGGGSYGMGERAGAQPHFIDLCRLLGVDSPDDADNYTFEKGTLRLGQKRGFADVFKRGCFGWEYKAPGGDLTAALRRSIILSFGMRCPKKAPSPVAGEGGVRGWWMSGPTSALWRTRPLTLALSREGRGDRTARRKQWKPSGPAPTPRLSVRHLRATRKCALLGDKYTETLRKVYVDRVPGGSDLVTTVHRRHDAAFAKARGLAAFD